MHLAGVLGNDTLINRLSESLDRRISHSYDVYARSPHSHDYPAAGSPLACHSGGSWRRLKVYRAKIPLKVEEFMSISMELSELKYKAVAGNTQSRISSGNQ